jgi:hypothetical protein
MLDLNCVLHKLRIRASSLLKRIDPRFVREKESTAIITIVERNPTGKQIELEFTNLLASDTWKWKARPVGTRSSS